MRNILAKLPRMMQPKMKGLVHQVFRAPSYNVALKRGRDLVDRFQDRYSAAMECLARDLEECVTYLRFPDAHHQRIRTTNRLERLNGEARRRTKVHPAVPERARLLVVALCEFDHCVEHWRGIPMTPAIVRQLQPLRTETDTSAAKEAVA